MNENGIVFDVLLRASDSCNTIARKLEEIEQSNSIINDQYLSNLIKETSDLSVSLSHNYLEGDEYLKLIENSRFIEPFIYINTKLEEIVNIPSEVDSSIQLIELSNNFQKKFAHQLEFINNIHQKTENLRRQLVCNLCNRLDDLRDAKLDDLKRLINQLIRCAHISDRDLRLRFLQARDNWFNNECDAKGESFDELITFFCDGLPRVFEEYKHIFADDSQQTDRHFISRSPVSPAKEDGAIINSWLLLKTSTFILSLEVHLKSISQSKFLTPTMISDTMQKCFKLTDWLSSTGFDFNSQLRPLFSRTIIEEVKFSVEQATKRFEAEFTVIVSKSIESLLLPIEDKILRISNLKTEEQVPKSICHYPVFRIYCLNIIDSLRWIQTTKNILSPISLCLETYASLNSSLTRVMKALAAVLNMDNNSSHPILSKIAISYLVEVLPFITNYCELLFPEKVILSAIGMSKTEFKSVLSQEPDKLQNFRLDLKQIAEPLRSTMPALMHVIES